MGWKSWLRITPRHSSTVTAKSLFACLPGRDAIINFKLPAKCMRDCCRLFPILSDKRTMRRSQERKKVLGIRQIETRRRAIFDSSPDFHMQMYPKACKSPRGGGVSTTRQQIAPIYFSFSPPPKKPRWRSD